MSPLAIYLIGVGFVWLCTVTAISREPTAHGQDVLVPLGCILGLGWPLFLIYLVVASPWIAVTWLRGDR